MPTPAETVMAFPGDFTTAEVLARQIGFPLSDEAENITGTVLLCDGGYTP